MPIEIEKVNVPMAVVTTDVHRVNSFTEVIKITVKIDRDVKGYLELRHVCWIDGVLDVVQVVLIEIL